MTPTLPFWFQQRQAKAEPAGNDALRITAPNLREAFLFIRQGENGRWSASLRLQADGPEFAVTGQDFAKPEEAWEAAFELHRQHIVV
jgi:hypothetical protein